MAYSEDFYMDEIYPALCSSQLTELLYEGSEGGTLLIGVSGCDCGAWTGGALEDVVDPIVPESPFGKAGLGVLCALSFPDRRALFSRMTVRKGRYSVAMRAWCACRSKVSR